MSNKVKVLFVVIVGVFLVAIGIFASNMLVQRFQGNQQPSITQEETIKTDVVVVTRDLFLGDTLTESDLKVTSVSVEVAPRNVITDPAAAVGKIIKTDLIQGEMLLLHNLADPTNDNRDLSFILSEEHVLLAFPADDLMSSESMVQRGDIVDIFATFKQKVKTIGETTSETTEPEMRTFTVDTLQKVGVTALVLEVIEEESTKGTTQLLPGQTGAETIVQPKARISAYLLALNPQDALVLKHLKDTDAIFDIVLRAPTSTVQFNLTPVTEEYIIEFYGLEILP
ncbi:MAG: Flp pilus assembly protein CpaB [Anaerolineaceae bacterium]